MKDAIENRELIVIDGPDVAIRGTYHKASHGSSRSRSDRIGRDRMGVIFLNHIAPTRSGRGDSFVYLADSFAEYGYPSFRLDFAGFGDSGGNPPGELLNFINTGGYAPIVSAKIKELVVRFNLSGVVIMGLCAGAVSALYAAAASMECKGLVLMNPYFHLPLRPRSKVWGKLAMYVSQNALGRLVGRTLHRARKIRVLLLGNRPPRNSNFPLLNCWRELESAGLPILILNTPTTRHRGGEFDYIRYVLGQADCNCKVIVKVIECATHSFSDPLSRAAVRHHTESWLNAFFPLAEMEESSVVNTSN